MINRLKAILADFFQQADLMLLGLCSSATVFGILLIFSATQYKKDSRYVIIQTVALLLGICVYIGFSMVDLEILMKKWKWVLAFNVGFILLLITPLGTSVGGNRAWLKFPGIPVSVGPAEVVKITFVLLLAWQIAWLRKRNGTCAPSIPPCSRQLTPLAFADFILSSPAIWETGWCSCLFSSAWPCGGLCPAVVCPAAGRRCRGGDCGLEPGFDAQLYERPLHRAVRPFL